mmetsp:Transcript_57227/g.186026  ORF Transcript_57227/g.186026 Transcript_57227/m.186026 type:complete len:210 (+) Transcript_57227:82-711(+)
MHFVVDVCPTDGALAQLSAAEVARAEMPAWQEQHRLQLFRTDDTRLLLLQSLAAAADLLVPPLHALQLLEHALLVVAPHGAEQRVELRLQGPKLLNAEAPEPIRRRRRRAAAAVAASYHAAEQVRGAARHRRDDLFLLLLREERGGLPHIARPPAAAIAARPPRHHWQTLGRGLSGAGPRARRRGLAGRRRICPGKSSGGRSCGREWKR